MADESGPQPQKRGDYYNMEYFWEKNNFFRSSPNQCKQGTCDIVSQGTDMPYFVSNRVQGSSIYLYQYTLYQSVSVTRRLRKTAPDGSPGMATQGRIQRGCSGVARTPLFGKNYFIFMGNLVKI